MHSMKQIETRQIGLKLPTYLVDELDEFLADFKVNRSTFIQESIRDALRVQKENHFYEGLGEAMSEVKSMIDGKIPKIDAREFIDELKNQAN